jgi:hypothetical protein
MYGEQPVGPLRVWAQGERAPGLCMTRALGDWLAASVGLIDEPEVMARQLAPEDRCAAASSRQRVAVLSGWAALPPHSWQHGTLPACPRMRRLHPATLAPRWHLYEPAATSNLLAHL